MRLQRHSPQPSVQVTHIDVVICNAGFPTPMTPALVTSAEDLSKSFEVNTIAPLLVFQAFWPLMQRSASPPKMVVISSSVSSIPCQEPFPGGAYGPSKAASNWITKALQLQNEADGLVAFALHPGWVQTRAVASSVKLYIPINRVITRNLGSKDTVTD